MIQIYLPEQKCSHFCEIRFALRRAEARHFGVNLLGARAGDGLIPSLSTHERNQCLFDAARELSVK